MHIKLRGLLLGLLLGITLTAVAEDLTITTYYPSPRGVYDELRTMGTTLLAIRPGSRVGVRLSDATGPGGPQAELHVNGDIIANNLKSPGPGGPSIAVPPGMIAMFDGGCPAGWTRYGALDGAVPRGDTAPGGTGGSDTHAHDFTYNHEHLHTHDVNPALFQNALDATPVADHAHSHPHDHDYSYSGATASSNDNSFNDDHERDWWQPTTSHGHDFSIFGTTSGPSQGDTDGAGGHGHTLWIDVPITVSTLPVPPGPTPLSGTTNDGDSWPPYRNMIFCRKDPYP